MTTSRDILNPMTTTVHTSPATAIRRGIISLAVGLFATVAGAESVVNSKHNLSASGPGPVRAVAETEVCIFCHTPHNASADPPLWNRDSSGVIYTPYSSSTAQATFGQPTGASKLCLSCHDGTVALGMVRSRSTPIAFSGGVLEMPPGRSNLGTDLSDDHPVSFIYDSGLAAADPQLEDPATLTGDVRLDANGEMQCTTCHDPHDDQYGDFLVVADGNGELCLSCHDPDGWSQTSHADSTATWNGQPPDPWPHSDATTVEANACANCHTPHDAGGHERLLQAAIEEDNCFACHNGNVAATDIEAEFSKFSVHPVLDTLNVHDPTEDLVDPPRHAECADCHNPHFSRDLAATAPDASGALAGVRGITASDAEVNPITMEYELCLRCHADSIDRGDPHVPRDIVETNTRLEFNVGNASFHPVVGVGVNGDVPSLISPLTESSMIYCTDCHNNDDGPGAGGVGPNGPHGSDYEPLLERQLVLTDGQGTALANHALCYKCHDSTSILSDASFSEHSLHVVNQEIACTTCHDPHGVATATHLINFNTDYVTPYSGVIEFVDTGAETGNCTLSCHGYDHDALEYPPPPGP